MSIEDEDDICPLKRVSSNASCEVELVSEQDQGPFDPVLLPVRFEEVGKLAHEVPTRSHASIVAAEEFEMAALDAQFGTVVQHDGDPQNEAYCRSVGAI